MAPYQDIPDKGFPPDPERTEHAEHIHRSIDVPVFLPECPTARLDMVG